MVDERGGGRVRRLLPCFPTGSMSPLTLVTKQIGPRGKNNAVRTLMVETLSYW